MNYKLFHGDNLEILKSFQDNSIDSIVTDPPYGLAFMAKKWDYSVPSEELWRECLRVLKPGGHLLSFAGTRTQHRMAVRIEDAGFEIRDMIAWVYGSGFPKSLDVSKAIDKAAGAEREVVGAKISADGRCRTLEPSGQKERTPIHGGGIRTRDEWDTAPATEAAKQWQGWGTALKPALEPITVARKPLIGTVASNVLEHGTGALNIDGCRVPTGDKLGGGHSSNGQIMQDGWHRPWMDDPKAVAENIARSQAAVEKAEALGRWPANLIHDGSGEVLACFPSSKSCSSPSTAKPKSSIYPGEDGSAARFFYCAKASKRDRDDGLEGFEEKPSFKLGAGLKSMVGHPSGDIGNTSSEDRKGRNHHPTVKPTDLMRYLCRLVTPAGGIVLDPFMGSGSTGKAAVLEGFHFIGIEMEEEYINIAKARIAYAKAGKNENI